MPSPTPANRDILFYCERKLKNGWKARIEIRPALTALQIGGYAEEFELPAECISNEITTERGFKKLPYGMENIPTMEIKFNLSFLRKKDEEVGGGGSSNYANAKNILLNPRVTASYDIVDYDNNATGDVIDIYVHNTICLYTDRGDPTNYQDVDGKPLWPEFIGIQNYSNERKIDLNIPEYWLDIECTDVNHSIHEIMDYQVLQHVEHLQYTWHSFQDTAYRLDSTHYVVKIDKPLNARVSVAKNDDIYTVFKNNFYKLFIYYFFHESGNRGHTYYNDPFDLVTFKKQDEASMCLGVVGADLLRTDLYFISEYELKLDGDNDYSLAGGFCTKKGDDSFGQSYENSLDYLARLSEGYFTKCTMKYVYDDTHGILLRTEHGRIWEPLRNRENTDYMDQFGKVGATIYLSELEVKDFITGYNVLNNVKATIEGLSNEDDNEAIATSNRKFTDKQHNIKNVPFHQYPTTDISVNESTMDIVTGNYIYLLSLQLSCRKLYYDPVGSASVFWGILPHTEQEISSGSVAAGLSTDDFDDFRITWNTGTQDGKTKYLGTAPYDYIYGGAALAYDVLATGMEIDGKEGIYEAYKARQQFGLLSLYDIMHKEAGIAALTAWAVLKTFQRVDQATLEFSCHFRDEFMGDNLGNVGDITLPFDSTIDSDIGTTIETKAQLINVIEDWDACKISGTLFFRGNDFT